jgi:hypothetical protein
MKKSLKEHLAYIIFISAFLGGNLFNNYSSQIAREITIPLIVGLLIVLSFFFILRAYYEA